MGLDHFFLQVSGGKVARELEWFVPEANPAWLLEREYSYSLFLWLIQTNKPTKKLTHGQSLKVSKIFIHFFFVSFRKRR